MGIFEWMRTYLSIEKLFQTWHCHMATTGEYGYKTGTLITKKFFFSNLLMTLNIVYMYISDEKETKMNILERDKASIKSYIER